MQFIRKGWINHFTVECREVQLVRIISPFITNGVVQKFLREFRGDQLEIITRFNLNDFQSGASSLQALKLLVERGARIQGIRNLHSKVYIFDQSKAIIASANLTTMAFYNNYEFGMEFTDTVHIRSCIDYFNWLKIRGGAYLDPSRISQWQEAIRVQGGNSPRPTLPDHGTDPNVSRIDKQYFIKLFGKSDDRVSLGFHARQELNRSHCHYALCFPTNAGRPRRYRDGDIVYMARMLEGTDYSLFGRAECLAHVDDRDNASEEEMEIIDWKERWGIYIRIKHPEFIDTMMGNCPRMSTLIQELGPDCYESTSRRQASGEADINPWNSLRQKADVQLTATAAMWLQDQFDHCLSEYGRVDNQFIQGLHQGSLY